MSQLYLNLDLAELQNVDLSGNYGERLATLLTGDLDFHSQASNYASHR